MAPSRASRRASRLREYRDADDEYRETRSKEAAQRRFRAMRSKDTTMEDFVHVNDEIDGRDEERRNRDKARLRKLRFSGWKPEEPPKNDKEG